MRRELAVLFLILAVAFGMRVYVPWAMVLTGDRVSFLENDAWYHIRLIENQVRNWPWRVTLDPYAAAGGQFVPIAPFFDTITASTVRVLFGRDASTWQIEHVAAFLPPILGTLTVAAVWALARRVFDWRAGLFAAAMLAIFPGHFLDRTLLGYYDHHALEALLAVTTLLAFARALDGGGRERPILVGVSLGLYLLGWGSGAFLVGVIGFWLALVLVVSRSSEELKTAARVTGVAAAVALVLVLVFQDARMFRYQSQILALAGLAALALTAFLLGRRALFVVVGGIVAAAVAVSMGMFGQLASDVSRFAPDAQRMGVLEARPLFLYSGQWSWRQPWEFFRTGVFVGFAALLLYTARVWRDRRAVDLLIWVFAASMFAATYGQNRFGYYLIPACAIVGGWLAVRVLEWGGHRSPRRELALVVIAGAMFAPNLIPTALSAARPGTLPDYWRDALVWLQAHTPPPFAHTANAGDEYYYARYPRASVPAPDYTVMNWWDHGYWIVQFSKRVPIANPTQERAPNAGRFYSTTSESDAVEVLTRERARYVLSDWELPFRVGPTGAMMGRFQNVLDWAGARHAGFYEVLYRRESNAWIPVWVFYEPYYRSMAFRLEVLAGKGATPANATTVLIVGDRIDNTGLRFSEIVSARTFATYDQAVAVAKQPQANNNRAVIAGLDPWNSAFPLEPLTRLHELQSFRSADQKPGESPYVRVFELR